MSAFQPCLFPNILRELRDECIIDQDNNETRKETTSIPVPFINEKEDILALDVVKLKKHLLEQLLVSIFLHEILVRSCATCSHRLSLGKDIGREEFDFCFA